MGGGNWKYFGGKVVCAVKSRSYFFTVDGVCHLNAYLDVEAWRNWSGKMPQKWIWSPDQGAGGSRAKPLLCRGTLPICLEQTMTGLVKPGRHEMIGSGMQRLRQPERLARLCRAAPERWRRVLGISTTRQDWNDAVFAHTGIHGAPYAFCIF
jgi:hypothetical protein